MAKGRHPKQLPPDAAACIAGLIDGEGTITLTRLHANENRRLVVSIANTEIQFCAGVTNAAAPWGFTGFHYVCEPSKSSELQSWCEKTP